MKKGEVLHINPENLSMNPAFTNVVTVTGYVKTIYIGGQDADPLALHENVHTLVEENSQLSPAGFARWQSSIFRS